MSLSLNDFQRSEANKTHGALYVNPQLLRGSEVLYLLVGDELFHPFEDEGILLFENVIVDDHRLEGIQDPGTNVESIPRGGFEVALTWLEPHAALTSSTPRALWERDYREVVSRTWLRGDRTVRSLW